MNAIIITMNGIPVIKIMMNMRIMMIILLSSRY